MQNEIWKGIKNFEDKYEVSTLGRVRSKTYQVPTKGDSLRTINGRIRKLQLNKKGYVIIGLSTKKGMKTFTVHQLVAQAFIPDFVKGTEINHVDGDKQNNAITNLEVSNPSHNQLHAIRTGLKPKAGITSKYRHVSFIKNPKAKKKWAVCIKHNGKSSFGWKTFYTEIEAAKYADELLDSINDTQRLRNFP